jgi:hypothetical protein
MALPKTDSFTASDQPLGTYNANWVSVTGSMSILSNGVHGATASDFSAFRWTGDTFDDKHYAQIVLTDISTTPSSTGTGVGIRMQSGANSFYYCLPNKSGVVFNGQMVAGTATDWDSGQSGAAQGDTIYLGIDPTTATTVLYKKNGTLVTTYTGKSALTGGAAGVTGYDSQGDCFSDDFEGGNVNTGSSSSGVGSSTATSTATATGKSLASSPAASASTSSATASSAGTASSAASSTGTSTATAVGRAIVNAVGVSSNSQKEYHRTTWSAEDPLSEGGIWTQGGVNGVSWQNVRVVTTGGTARMVGVGQDGSGAYDDPTALLTAFTAKDVHVRAVVYSKNANVDANREVEIRLRSEITPGFNRGYECMSNSSTQHPYMSLVRWNGPFGDFTELVHLDGAQYGVLDGDIFEAEIIGNRIKISINGSVKIDTTDDTWKDGKTGVGFFNHTLGATTSQDDYGFSALDVVELPATQAVGQSLASTSATATGTSTVTGTGRSIVASAAASVSTSTALGIAPGAATGSSVSASTATAVGSVLAKSVGASSGTSSAAGVAQSNAASVGSSSGISTTTGVGASVAASVGSSVATSTATADTSPAGSGIGHVTSTSTAIGVGSSIVNAVGHAVSLSTVLGRSTASSVKSVTVRSKSVQMRTSHATNAVMVQ